MWRGGVRDRSQAEAAIAAVLDAVAYHLTSQDRAFIAERMPSSLAVAARQPTAAAASRPSDLYAQLATAGQVCVGAAIEHAQAACGGLGEIVGEEARALLSRRLPPDWAALFAAAAVERAHDLPPGTVPGYGHTLATGRPGSSRALADAAGRDERPKR